MVTVVCYGAKIRYKIIFLRKRIFFYKREYLIQYRYMPPLQNNQIKTTGRRFSFSTFILIAVGIAFVIVVILVARSLIRQKMQNTLPSDVSSVVSTEGANTAGDIPRTQWPAPGADNADTDMIMGQAQVRTLAIEMGKIFPVQVRAMIAGDLPDACTNLATPRVDIDVARKQFTIVMLTERPATAVCTQAIVPYTRTVTLATTGMPAGNYTVIAGTARASFELTTDNSVDFSGDKG
jgi:inhibitor of cysteine peptidase